VSKLAIRIIAFKRGLLHSLYFGDELWRVLDRRRLWRW